MFLIFFGRRPDDYAGVPKMREKKPRDISRLFPVHWNGGVASLFAKIASDCFDGQGPGRPLPLAGDEGLHRQSLPWLGRERIRGIIHCHREKKIRREVR